MTAKIKFSKWKFRIPDSLTIRAVRCILLIIIIKDTHRLDQTIYIGDTYFFLDAKIL